MLLDDFLNKILIIHIISPLFKAIMMHLVFIEFLF